LPSAQGGDGPVVLFDGVCNLCARLVRFILDHERVDVPARIRFGALQSDGARRALAAAGVSDPASLGDSFVLIEGGRVYVRSEAAARTARYLRAPWRWASVARQLPRAVRDPLYAFVAQRRYRWFGKRESCLMPTAELRARFLD